MTNADDARDLAIHQTIERAFHTISNLHNISRAELRERVLAFVESEADEESQAERARAAIAEVCSREVDA